MMKNISIRLKDDFIKEADKLAKLELVDKSVIIREALEKGFAEVRLQTALDKFSEEKASTSEAAEIAGLSVGEMMDELVKRGLRPKFTKEDLQGGLGRALRVVK
ncbi:UPF0175 family protein [Candidatus Woesearchaeota archaeon]|nr:UPF0175 family protein [Candidatus Woesearchaeota archaeon]